MIVSIAAEKSHFIKFNTPLRFKKRKKQGINRSFLNPINNIHKKPTANTIFVKY